MDYHPDSSLSTDGMSRTQMKTLESYEVITQPKNTKEHLHRCNKECKEKLEPSRNTKEHKWTGMYV